MALGTLQGLYPVSWHSSGVCRATCRCLPTSTAMGKRILLSGDRRMAPGTFCIPHLVTPQATLAFSSGDCQVIFHCRRISTATARPNSSSIAHLRVYGLSDTPLLGMPPIILVTINGDFPETQWFDSQKLREA